MKKIVFKCLVFVVITLISAAVTSCDKETGGDVKLVESITWEEYGYVPWSRTSKFEYDKKNRIVKIIVYREGDYHSTQTITYGMEGSVKIEDDIDYWKVHFVRKKNTITANCNLNASLYDILPETLTVNSDECIVQWERSSSYRGGFTDVLTYQYQNRNLIKSTAVMYDVTREDRHYIQEFKYDKKKSPFYGCNTPRWLLQFLYGDIGINNNVVECNYRERESLTTFKYDYDYDSDGFAIKKSGDGVGFPIVTTFLYK